MIAENIEILLKGIKRNIGCSQDVLFIHSQLVSCRVRFSSCAPATESVVFRIFHSNAASGPKVSIGFGMTKQANLLTCGAT